MLSQLVGHMPIFRRLYWWVTCQYFFVFIGGSQQSTQIKNSDTFLLHIALFSLVGHRNGLHWCLCCLEWWVTGTSLDADNVDSIGIGWWVTETNTGGGTDIRAVLIGWSQELNPIISQWSWYIFTIYIADAGAVVRTKCCRCWISLYWWVTERSIGG